MCYLFENFQNNFSNFSLFRLLELSIDGSNFSPNSLTSTSIGFKKTWSLWLLISSDLSVAAGKKNFLEKCFDSRSLVLWLVPCKQTGPKTVRNFHPINTVKSSLLCFVIADCFDRAQKPSIGDTVFWF